MSANSRIDPRRAARPTLVAAALLLAGAGETRAQAAATPLHLRPDPASNFAVDPNGFLLNPVWRGMGAPVPDVEAQCRFRVGTGHLEQRTLLTTRGPCLSDAELDVVTLTEAPTILGLGFVCKTNSQIGNVRGHINWFPVTATGLLGDMNYTNGPGADNDVTLNLGLARGALTRGNRPIKGLNVPGYHIEFYARESIFELPAPGNTWWHALQAATLDKSRRSQVVDRRLAIVTGLYGLDGVHDFWAELHTVFGMAVLVDTTRAPSGRLKEEWAIMVQNQGNEGDCAHGRFPMHTAPEGTRYQHYVMDLGWWAGASGAKVELESGWVTEPFPEPAARTDARNGHLYIDFPHRRPSPTRDGYLFLGTLSVEWESDGRGSWRDRFDGWLPAGIDFKLGGVPVVEVDSMEIEKLRTALPPDLPGRDALRRGGEGPGPDRLLPRRLHRLVPAPLPSIQAGWLPATKRQLRADAVVPWDYRPAERGCEPGHSARDPICRGSLRFALASSWTWPRGAYRPFLYVFAPAHSWRGLGWFGEALQSVGWRLDARYDHVVLTAPESGGRQTGFGLRFGPVFLADNFRIKDAVVLSPYVGPRVAAFFGKGGTRVGWGIAAGLQLQVSYTEFFLEIQEARLPGAEFQNSIGFGIILARPFW